MKIDLTDTEITHILDALDARIEDLTDTLTFAGDPMIQDEISALQDLSMDLFEAMNRRDDGWGDDADEEASEPDAALDMVQAGIDAREQAKASSRAAGRRQQQLAERMMKGTATPCHPDFMNDPVDW